MTSIKNHWDNIFLKTDDTKLGWHEKDTSQTFILLNKISNIENATVFLPGAGTSVLIEDLLPKVNQLIINDISNEALIRVKKRLKEGTHKIIWLCKDISQPIEHSLPKIDIWIDRAVLHFLTSEHDIKGYFYNLKSVLKINGYALFAEFSMTGARKCAGLPIHRYSIDELSQELGSSFKIISHHDYKYINPFGEPKPYIYALFRRIG